VKTTVLDASVAAKWFLPASAEPLRKQALTLLESYRSGQLRFVVPDLFWSELANVFWKAFRQRRWEQSDAENALRLARERNFPTLPAIDLLGRASQIAMAFDRSVYDSVYIAAALATNSELVTSDERLANAVAATLPVKWLGAIR
jgi:predicted nucleic acid-binding protein